MDASRPLLSSRHPASSSEQHTCCPNPRIHAGGIVHIFRWVVLFSELEIENAGHPWHQVPPATRSTSALEDLMASANASVRVLHVVAHWPALAAATLCAMSPPTQHSQATYSMLSKVLPAEFSGVRSVQHLVP